MKPQGPLLIIFSGLPGTGKTTLARKLAVKLGIPLFRIDDFVAFLPQYRQDQPNPLWEELILVMFRFVEAQLELGVSAIVDSVFMGEDRVLASDVAARHGAAYRPIYTYISEERLWRQRVEERLLSAPPEDEPSTWETIQKQKMDFASWEEGQALFVDGADSVESNLSKVLQYVTA